ncbi:MAG TPA: ferrous iron transport protein B [Firmicutes bacterium]|nr:ferrous iron transport protein B [Bacillota bacterium]
MKTISLVGNPNSGKTTVFNALTGSNQHVGNWPGVTVEKKIGKLKYKGHSYRIVDLPGTYSLGAYSEDEIIARDFILQGQPDVVVNVVDATNIERNLYLTVQLLEMGAQVIVALNMVDEAEKRKISFDVEALSKRLGVPVVPMVASKRKGIDHLLEAVANLLNGRLNMQADISYGARIDSDVNKVKRLLGADDLGYPADWLAVKLLEGDEYVLQYLREHKALKGSELQDVLQKYAEKSDHYQLEIVDKRYEFVKRITDGAVFRPSEEVKTLTDKIDRVVTHKYWGLPIFGMIMLVVFQLTFTVGEDLLGELAEDGIEMFGQFLGDLLLKINAPAWLSSFVAEGLIGGVGAVVEFVPLIVILYLLFGILEDSGYMARAAYVMDNIMRALGLQGKTFISMIVGFGCNVPGIMSTRTLENKKDRMIAILINPFMSCGAKLPIYLVFIAAFFPKRGGLVLFSIYFIGILMALLMGQIFSKVLFPGEASHFIMELPPYRMPTLTNVLRNMWDNVHGFLTRAGTTIFLVVSLLWVLAVLPGGAEPYGAESILGRIGLLVAPIFKPAGFGNWQAAVGLFSGIAAKEAVVATLGMVYAGVEEGVELIGAIRGAFTPLTAVSFLLMTLLYTPCAATIATIRKETNSTKWALFTALYTFGIGWAVAVLVFQVGTALGFA